MIQLILNIRKKLQEIRITYNNVFWKVAYQNLSAFVEFSVAIVSNIFEVGVF